MKSPKPSVVEAAWSAYFKAEETDDLEALRKEGWKTAGDAAKLMSISKCAARKRLESNRDVEQKSVKAFCGGVTRTINVYRPRIAVDPAARKV
jgi:predicted ArsR family transcriptional regulator